jgi:hypothetical protein
VNAGDNSLNGIESSKEEAFRPTFKDEQTLCKAIVGTFHESGRARTPLFRAKPRSASLNGFQLGGGRCTGTRVLCVEFRHCYVPRRQCKIEGMSTCIDRMAPPAMMQPADRARPQSRKWCHHLASAFSEPMTDRHTDTVIPAGCVKCPMI